MGIKLKCKRVKWVNIICPKLNPAFTKALGVYYFFITNVKYFLSHQVFDPSFLKFSLPVCLLTVITNTWAIVAIQHKNDQTVTTITNIITVSPPPR